jgi:peptidoglycan hydrolase-like protein with peptidoglycan-binding domain
MKNTLLLLLCVTMTGSVWADDLTRAIQQRLKDQGFYYGDVDGQGGDETSAAIRRYQIRYGLRVTGQLNDETLHSLGISRDSVTRPAPGYQDNGSSFSRQQRQQQPSQAPYQQAPYQQAPYEQAPYEQAPYRQPPYPQRPGEDYGQPVPSRPGPEDYDEARPAPFSAPAVATSYPRLFAGTIYERAPSRIQENVLYAVQGELMKKGLFRGIIDGRPGPATTDAILRLQREEELPMSGRLDNETLNELRAFPGQRNGPPEFSRPWPPGERFGFPGPRPF